MLSRGKTTISAAISRSAVYSAPFPPSLCCVFALFSIESLKFSTIFKITIDIALHFIILVFIEEYIRLSESESSTMYRFTP